MYKNILVAIDDSETSRCALKEALHIARTSNAKLYITHVADETLLSMHSRTVSTTLDFDQAVTAIADAGRKLLDEAMQAAAGVNAEPLLLEAMNRRVSKPWLKKPKHWMLT
jgi:nucleotide-binding universal stress UspA family protein